jgi:hypothetical protein
MSFFNSIFHAFSPLPPKAPEPPAFKVPGVQRREYVHPERQDSSIEFTGQGSLGWFEQTTKSFSRPVWEEFGEVLTSAVLYREGGVRASSFQQEEFLYALRDCSKLVDGDELVDTIREYLTDTLILPEPVRRALRSRAEGNQTAMKSTNYTPRGYQRTYKINSEAGDDEGSVQFEWLIERWPISFGGDQLEWGHLTPMITKTIGILAKCGEYTTPARVLALCGDEAVDPSFPYSRSVWEEGCRHVANYINNEMLVEPSAHADHKAEYLPGQSRHALLRKKLEEGRLIIKDTATGNQRACGAGVSDD